MRLGGPRVAPISGAARQVVALLHGFGANGDDLIGLAEYFRPILPDALYVAPDAPNICALNPAGLEWFDLSEENPDRVAKLAAAARPALADFLEELWEETGLGAADTMLIGFSQGAMMALEVGLRLETELMGIIGFSGALPGAASLASEIRSRPPVCLLHGSADPVVPYALGLATKGALEGLGIEVAFHSSPGAGHTITPDGLDFATGFLRRLAATREGPET